MERIIYNFVVSEVKKIFLSRGVMRRSHYKTMNNILLIKWSEAEDIPFVK